jgi:methylmalonyl-CoA/ethylmalonyl-CoA epimerase
MTLKDAKVQLTHIGQIAIPVKAMARAVTFYRDSLGLTFLFEAPPNLAFFDCGGVRLMLSVPESSEFERPGSILYFSVEDIQGAFKEMTERGVNFRQGPELVAKMPDHDLWLASFMDTEGNTLALMSEVRQ